MQHNVKIVEVSFVVCARVMMASMVSIASAKETKLVLKSPPRWRIADHLTRLSYAVATVFANVGFAIVLTDPIHRKDFLESTASATISPARGAAVWLVDNKAS